MNVGFAPRIFLITGGLLIWAAAFLFNYVFAAIACARGFADVQWLGIGLATLVPTSVNLIAIAGLALVAMRARRAGLASSPTGRGTHDSVSADIACIVCLLALIAIAWNALAPLVVGVRC